MVGKNKLGVECICSVIGIVEMKRVGIKYAITKVAYYTLGIGRYVSVKVYSYRYAAVVRVNCKITRWPLHHYQVRINKCISTSIPVGAGKFYCIYTRVKVNVGRVGSGIGIAIAKIPKITKVVFANLAIKNRYKRWAF